MEPTWLYTGELSVMDHYMLFTIFIASIWYIGKELNQAVETFLVFRQNHYRIVKRKKENKV